MNCCLFFSSSGVKSRGPILYCGAETDVSIFRLFQDYGATLERAGFGDVVATDNTAYFIEILKAELTRYKPKKAAVLKEFSEADYDAICDGWEQKIDRCAVGDQVWGYFKAQKMYE